MQKCARWIRTICVFPAGVCAPLNCGWNTFVIRVAGQVYNVSLKGEPVVTYFQGTRSARGYIGVQNHSPTDQVYFRNVGATPLS